MVFLVVSAVPVFGRNGPLFCNFQDKLTEKIGIIDLFY